MSSYRSNGRWVVVLSCLAALVLQMMPWPKEIYMLRPAWLELILIYWVMALPHRVNVGTAFVLGIIWDLTLGSTLGIRSIALSVVAYLVAFKSQLLRNMALWQQALVVVLLSFLTGVMIFVLEIFLRHVSFSIDILWHSLINGILWPWLFLLMRKIRRKFSVR
jgi:rod shape-determining protein MreD